MREYAPFLLSLVVGLTVSALRSVLLGELPFPQLALAALVLAMALGATLFRRGLDEMIWVALQVGCALPVSDGLVRFVADFSEMISDPLLVIAPPVWAIEGLLLAPFAMLGVWGRSRLSRVSRRT